MVVPPRATAVPSDTAETAPPQRDRHLRCLAEQGRMGWRKASGHDRRSKAAAALAGWKQAIGDGLRAHADERRPAEVGVAAHARDRMLESGRPTYVRLA